MSDFWIYYQIGLKHVLTIYAYDHILFLLALTVPYDFKSWKKLLIMISFFTLGHTLSLFLTVFNIVSFKTSIAELVIPFTILITALYNIIASGKSSKNNNLTFLGIVTVFFGIIHGLGFSNYFNSILSGKPSDKLLPLTEFALGIESAQIIVVLLALLTGYVVQTLFKFSKRDWTLTISAFIVGVVITILVQNNFWSK